MQTAVKIDGKLNNPDVVSKGLTLELAFPWSGMTWLANGHSLPPQIGDIWKIFMGRYEMLSINGMQESVGWARDKIGTNDNHYPERFTPIRFTDA